MDLLVPNLADVLTAGVGRHSAIVAEDSSECPVRLIARTAFSRKDFAAEMRCGFEQSNSLAVWCLPKAAPMIGLRERRNQAGL